MLTIGRTIYPGMRVPLWYDPEERLQPRGKMEEPRYRLILLQEGSGIVSIGGRTLTFVSPALFCLDETEEPVLRNPAIVKAESLFFDPGFINNRFNFFSLKDDKVPLDLTDRRDRHWLRPFFERKEGHGGYLKITPLFAGKINRLMLTIARQLQEQPDGYWPCRSRSYLIELLLGLERVYMSHDNPEELILVESDAEIDELILYLNDSFREKITIADLTQKFHLNRTTLAQRFHKATGMSVINYLIRLRLDLAAALLKDTGIPVSEIMDRIGFGDLTNFRRMFSKRFSCSPTEYRQRHSWLS